MTLPFRFGVQVARAPVAYADPPRAEAPAVISELRARGIEAVMLTGDSREVAAAVAAKLGIGRVVAEAFPHRKADVVRAPQHEGHGVVGDGINDSRWPMPMCRSRS